MNKVDFNMVRDFTGLRTVSLPPNAQWFIRRFDNGDHDVHRFNFRISLPAEAVR